MELKAAARHIDFVLPASFTAGLRPENYELAAAGLTGVGQPLVIGPGLRPTPFHIVQYGDYDVLNPTAGMWDAADVAAAHVARTRKLGFNLMVDRLGFGSQLHHVSADGIRREAGLIHDRLKNDPRAVAPEKVHLAPTLLQIMAGYEAHGVEQMAILMGNDAGLLLGRPFDQRKPEEFRGAIQTVTTALAPYRSFRGWSWSSNWWVLNPGGSAAPTPEEKGAYEAAFKRARETGAWDAVLEKVSGHRLG